jgi:hypothetical protein
VRVWVRQQINQCVVHVSGALLLDRPDDFDTDVVLRTVPGDAQWANHATASSTAPGTFDPTGGAEVEVDDGWAYDDGGYDDNDAGGGFEDDTGGVPALEGRANGPFVPEQHPDGGYDSDQQMGGVVAVVGQPKPIRKAVDPDFDPYAPLDPDDAGDAAAVKPFKKGATYKRMLSGGGGGGKRTTGAGERGMASVPAATARGLLFPEFEAAAKAVRDLQRKQRMATLVRLHPSLSVSTPRWNITTLPWCAPFPLTAVRRCAGVSCHVTTMQGGGSGRLAAKAAAVEAAVEATLFPGDADDHEDGGGGGCDPRGPACAVSRCHSSVLVEYSRVSCCGIMHRRVGLPCVLSFTLTASRLQVGRRRLVGQQQR